MLVKMLFTIALILFITLSFFVDLPPGTFITDLTNFSSAQYTFLTNNLLNGIVYGTIIALAAFLARRNIKPKSPKYSSYETTKISSLVNDIEKLVGKESNLTEIEGIGPKRALELELAGVKTISDLAKRSPKHLAKKTGMPITQISKWIIEANKLTK